MMYIAPYELERLVELRIEERQLEQARSHERALIQNSRFKSTLGLKDVFATLFQARPSSEDKVLREKNLKVNHGLTINSQECFSC